MMLRLLIDMNLSPDWVPYLAQYGWQAIHWSTVGDPRAPDPLIMEWARSHHHVVFTHDLDFGTTLALTHATGPSVLQIRFQNVLPDVMGKIIVPLLTQYEPELEAGALVVADPTKSRVRILPF
jgi:predicted nuclease of predicted toxin-antitoxin system